MSSPLQVRVARAGKEVGSYDSAEVLRLLGAGTLKPTDHYWHSGMGGWELLSKLDASDGLRLRAEAEKKLNREKAERESSARDEELLRQRVRGLLDPSGVPSEAGEWLVCATPSKREMTTHETSVVPVHAQGPGCPKRFLWGASWSEGLTGGY